MFTRTAPSSSPDPAPGAPAWPRPVRPRLPGWLAYRLQRVLAPNAGYRWLAGVLSRSPVAYRAFTATERAGKGGAFGCRMCGQCTLPVTGYACPETCPKKLRNGPCGGVGADGSCEVFPDTRCVWVVAYAGGAHGSATGPGMTRTCGPRPAGPGPRPAAPSPRSGGETFVNHEQCHAAAAGPNAAALASAPPA